MKMAARDDADGRGYDALQGSAMARMPSLFGPRRLADERLHLHVEILIVK